MKPHKRLQLARINSGFRSGREASERFRWPVSSYSRHEAGLSSFRKMAHEYAKAFGVTPDYLLGKESHEWSIPIVDSRDFGTLTAIARGTELIPEGNFWECGPRSFGMVNPDNSMTSPHNRRIYQGDLLLFDPDANFVDGCLVLVMSGNEALFRAYAFPTATHFTAVPLNPEFQRRTFKGRPLARLVSVIVNADTLF